MVSKVDHDKRGQSRLPLRDASAVQRLLLAAAIGVIVGPTISAVAPWQFATLAGWDAAAAFLVGWVLLVIRQSNAQETRSHATREDNSRTSTQLILICASIASLGGTGLDMVKAGQAAGNGKRALTIVAVLTVALSWAVVHSLFTLRYAHEYYSPPDGGIDFNAGDGDPPDYQDFAYVAFTVGMTFQVSDTEMQARTIRRTVLHHALLAYLFGAVILAVTINVIAGIIQ